MECEDDDPIERERVSSRIGQAIVQFFDARAGALFHADELRQHVTRECGAVAPGSPDRILRLLRQQGVVAYEVVHRRRSLYRAGQDLNQGL